MGYYGKGLDHLATHKFFDQKFKTAGVKVLPGEYYATKDNIMITTLLGSCISACLYDDKAKVGGLNHFLLPGEENSANLLSSSGRYGMFAMELLINHLMKLGATREHLKAKVFGGARVIKGMTSANVGQHNVDFITLYLDQESIPISALSVLDIYPRKVNFFPSSGRVYVKQLTGHYDSELIAQEKKYQGQAQAEADQSGGEIDLF